jgi:hypothetical protein
MSLRRANGRSLAVCTVAFATLVLGFAIPALATVAVPVSRATLVQRSDLVVYARIGARQSAWNDDHTQIVTLTELSVRQYLKGAGPETLLLRQLGGTVDNLRSRISGDPEFSPGQDVVLFLRQGEGVVFLFAMAQAAYFVDPATSAVRRELDGIVFAIGTGRDMRLVEPGQEPRESLTHLLADIRALARGSR